MFLDNTRAKISSFACCHYAEDIEKLKSSNLRNLGKDDLEVYFNNTLTIGDTNTYKYFLPRIFEVFANDFDLLLEIQICVKGYEWREWQIAEINAIENHLLSLWKSGTRFYDSEYFLALFSFSKLLKLWKKDTIFLKQNIDYWETESNFFKPYWKKKRQTARLYDSEKTAIIEFLGEVYLENMEKDIEYSAGLSEVISFFSKCKTYV